jgi:hypothetical protein
MRSARFSIHTNDDSEEPTNLWQVLLPSYGKLFSFKRLRDEFRNIFVLELGVLRFDPVFEHDHAERAGAGDELRSSVGLRFCESLLGLCDPQLVDALAGFFFQPHEASARATAHPALAMALHLDELDPRNLLQNISWRVEDAIVAPQIARIVICNRRRNLFGELEPALPEQLFDELGVMDDFVMPAQSGIFVLKGVEAMRADRENLLDVIILKCLDVLLGEHLEDILMADAPGGVTGAALLFAEHSEADPSVLQDLHDAARDLLRSGIERRRTADEEEILKPLPACGTPLR